MQVRKEDIREYLYTQGGVSREVLSEREIAEQFDIKRNHARELLLELVGEGVVERHPRSGYRYVDYRGTRPGSAIMMRISCRQRLPSKWMSLIHGKARNTRT